MHSYADVLKWLNSQQKVMQDLLREWSSINSYSLNPAGIKQLSQKVKKAFSTLGPVQSIALKSPALSIQKRPQASKQILLVCHLDTVYPPNSSFKKVNKQRGVLKGPAVADAKGGIVVMLKALEAFEKTSVAKNLGWRVIINTDEEIGSPHSSHIWKKIASQFDVGLIFEPSLPNGDLVSARRGSANLTLTAHGRSAHAGRNPQDGRNAIQALAECIYKVEALAHKNCRINFGYWEGGGPVNVVTDSAMTRFNVRFSKMSDYKIFTQKLAEVIKNVERKREVKLVLSGGLTAPAKPLIPKTLKLLKMVKQCGRELGLNLSWRETAGVCDGNRLQALGLPTIDTLGVRGDYLHSPQEFMYRESLVERAKLTTLLLLKLAEGKSL